MSITRIFRVRIHPELKREFEEKFASVSVPAVAEAPGVLGVSIFKATKWAPNEYAMISHWDHVDALKAFAEEAIKRGTGARALRSIFERIMLDVMYDIPSRNDVEMVTITRQAVLGEKPPNIKKRRTDNGEDAA